MNKSILLVSLFGLFLTACGGSDTDTETKVQKEESSLLIIRVSFSDYQIKNNASIWHDKLFGTSLGQLNDYYDEISYGKFGFKEASESFGDIDDGIIDVILPYSHPHPENDLFKKSPIAIDAYNMIDDFIDMSSFDKNNDNVITRDELLFVFVIAGQETSHPITNFLPEGSRGVGAHRICFAGRGHTRNNITLFECKPESTQVGNFVIVGERHAKHDATIGQIAHELGHATFGIPDLYDIDNTSSGIGTFGLMAHGSWGKKKNESFIGETPTHMTAWSKIQAGFIEAEKITGSVDGLRVAGTTSSEYKPYRIDTGKEGEYFLIENRSANGYDKGLEKLAGLNANEEFKGGLLILHIDDSISTNANESHKKVDVVEASNSGLDDKSHRGHINNLFFEGNINEVTLESYDGTPIVNIKNISSPGTIMTIDIERL